MSYLIQPYSVLLISAAALSATMAISVIKMRSTLGTRSFTGLMGAVALWALVALFEVISEDRQTKVFSYSIKYLFIVFVPLAWLSFGLYYANLLRRWRIPQLLSLSVIPLVTLALIATNRAHGWMFSSLEWHQYDKNILLFRQFGPWFWIHTTYSYILISVGFFGLVKSLVDSPTPYRGQLISLLIGGLAPWACNMLFIFKGTPIPHLDLTPFAFCVSGLAFLWGFMRYRLLDLVPIAREYVIQNLNDGIIVIDEAQRILDINPTAAQLAMALPNDLIGCQVDQAIPWWTSLITLQNNAATEDRQELIIQVGGNSRWIRASITPLTQIGRPMEQLVLISDITVNKRSEEALRVSEDRFKSLTENAPILIFSLNESGELTYVNPAWTHILGYRRQEVIGQLFHHYVANYPQAPPDDLFGHIISGKEPFAEINLELIHRDGSKRIFDLTAAINSDTEGRITGIIGLAKDVSEETQLQEQLLMSQKMEAIGTLAGGIAHDFNNLLMGIQANISLMRLEAGQGNPVQEKLNRIENQIQNGASLTRQLLGYARKGKYTIHTIDIRGLIEDTLHVVKRTNKQIEVYQNFDALPLLMEADRGQIELVLLNLFVNAVDAMPDGGKLTLQAGLVDSQDLNGQWPDIKPGCFIKIEVTDTGIGMDDQTRDRIFEPFFTTKAIGQGTGLGLASVYGVVQNHEGYIRAESIRGQGTTFIILFPASKAPPQSGDTPLACREPEIQVPPGAAILLVDDEPNILEFCGEMIQSLGYRVLYAGGGKEAVHAYEEHQADIDLVILDMIMPVLDGIAVYQALIDINPQVKVIISSGSGLNKRAKQILAEGPHGNLKKPYTRSELVTAIAKVKTAAANAQPRPTVP